MSWQLRTEPIDRWPLKDTRPRTSPLFKARYDQTLKLLSQELDHLGARDAVVMQVVTRFGGQDLRRDGMLRADAKIEHPGCRLSFVSKHGPLTYATDRFEPQWSGGMPGWQANLRAIALGLEALRTVDRYGISRSGEQYRGWLALDASADVMPEESEAWEILRYYASLRSEALPEMFSSPELVKWARVGAHPDRNGGDHSGSDEVLRAIKVLGLETKP